MSARARFPAPSSVAAKPPRMNGASRRERPQGARSGPSSADPSDPSSAGPSGEWSGGFAAEPEPKKGALEGDLVVPVLSDTRGVAVGVADTADGVLRERGVRGESDLLGVVEGLLA